MDAIRRFDMVFDGDGCLMEGSEDGRYVQYREHAAIVAKKDVEIELLKQRVRELQQRESF